MSLLALALAAALGGCDQEAASPAGPTPPLPGRFAAVKAKPKKVGAAAAVFCDRRFTSEEAARFRWPELASAAPTPTSPSGWRWVNLWATWCKPCVEEMPMLARWQAKLAGSEALLDLQFLSLGDTAAQVEAFRAAHPGVPASLTLPEDADYKPWLTEMGVDGAGGVPIHLFVDPAGAVRCIRSGAIEEKDYAAVTELITL